MSSTRSIILAVLALTFACAWHVSLEALAVLFLTKTVFALASLEMLLMVLVHLVFKGLDVSLQNVSDRISPLFLEVLVVVAHIDGELRLLLALTGWAASCFVSEAFAVELEALGVLALAAHALLDSWLLL